MAKEFSRKERVGDYLQRELSLTIQRELRDPRLGMVSITAVEVSRDLSHARVFVTLLGCDTEEEAKPSIAVLNKAGGFLRSALARDASMRSVPRLRFMFDASIGRGRDLEALIDRAAQADANRATDGAAGEDIDDVSSDAEDTANGRAVSDSRES